MKSKIKEFESLCRKELNLLQEFGIDADFEEITEEKKILFESLHPYLNEGNITSDEKACIDNIKEIQGKSEALYKELMNSIRSTVESLRKNKKGITNYKVSTHSSSFIDQSG